MTPTLKRIVRSFSIGWILTGAAAVPARAVEMTPATAEDIYDALGRDAIGLRISPDTLPDLFTLTAGGIDQDAKQLTVEETYFSGPWKGGKAVIEYSRDLSSTRVTLYDKMGQRQRQYSVHSKVATPGGYSSAAPAASTSTVESGTPARFVWNDQKRAYIPMTPAVAAPLPDTVSPPPMAPPSDDITLETPATAKDIEISTIPVVKILTKEMDFAAQRALATALAEGNPPKTPERSTPVLVHHDAKKEELLASTFEKYEGPAYGRHREYERRFIPGKNRLSQAPEHDFYVDEVDRRKGIHNIYYYVHQTGMAPKLIALERHQKVSFLENFDIAKEDKGDIRIYH